MPRERDEKPKQDKQHGEQPGTRTEAQANVADDERESSQPEASSHKGTAGDVYGR